MKKYLIILLNLGMFRTFTASPINDKLQHEKDLLIKQNPLCQEVFELYKKEADKLCGATAKCSRAQAELEKQLKTLVDNKKINTMQILAAQHCIEIAALVDEFERKILENNIKLREADALYQAILNFK